MCILSKGLFTAGLFLVSLSAWGQTGNACDLTQDGKVDASDVQAAINMSLGISPCTANIAGANTCNVVVVQRVINASMGAACATTMSLHVVSLNWAASSSSVTGYNVYRSTSSGGPYTLVQSVGMTTSFTDKTVLSGQTYYYVVTAVSNGVESSYSNQAQAVVTVP